MLIAQWSCQSDARDSSRIPPALTAEIRTSWEKDALESLSNLIRRKIDLDVNYYKRAKIYFNNEQYELAIEDINNSIQLKDNISDYYLLRARINRELNKLDNALEDAQRAEGLQQDSPDLYILLADILQEKKQFQEARRYLNISMQMAPHEGYAYHVKGALQSNMADTLASIESYRKALELNPRMIRSYQQLGRIYTRMGDVSNALAVNNLALSRFPKNAELHLVRGDIYQRAYKQDSALISYQNALELDPSLLESHMKRGNIYLKWRSFYAALKSFESVLRYQTDYPEINYLIGFCLEKLGNKEKALEFYTLETQHDPNNQLAIAGVYRVQSQLQRAAQFNPNIYRTKPVPTTPQTRAPMLDTSRVKVNTIQPRSTIQMGNDSTRRKVIIK